MSQEDLATTLLCACDDAHSYAEKHWQSVPAALDAISDVTVLMLQVPGPEAAQLRAAAAAFGCLIRSVRFVYGTGNIPLTEHLLFSLSTTALTLAVAWRDYVSDSRAGHLTLPGRVLH